MPLINSAVDPSEPLGLVWQRQSPRAIVIIGATGGIGSALTAYLKKQFTSAHIIAVGHTVSADSNYLSVDFRNEETISACASSILSLEPELDIVINCAGLLHNNELQPEKSLGQLNQRALRELMDINAFGPVLLAKALAAGFKHNRRSLFASLSARVGSISDNTLGGWYSYRASKAAHNMLLANLALEWKRTLRDTTVVMLQPGTVDTQLSSPFQKGVKNLFSPEESIRHLWQVLESLTLAETGDFLDWKGDLLGF